MKTLVDSDNVSLWLFDDDKGVYIGETRTEVGTPLEFYISDMRTDTCTLHTEVTAPENWVSEKYRYTTDEGWVLNPDYVPYVPSTDTPSESE